MSDDIYIYIIELDIAGQRYLSGPIRPLDGVNKRLQARQKQTTDQRKRKNCLKDCCYIRCGQIWPAENQAGQTLMMSDGRGLAIEKVVDPSGSIEDIPSKIVLNERAKT